MTNTISYHSLPNGLRIVHRKCKSMVEYCGLAVNIGSRDEAPHHHGLAHFVEHTIFKGTDHRRSWHIINRMEAVGGELNAYTTKEETLLYSIFPKGNLSRAVDLISDLVSHSRFPQIEIEHERAVVIDEINSYLDTPSEAIFDDFEDLLFSGSSLGHNILGTTTTINSFTPEVCHDYLATHYTPGNMVFFYMGPASPDKVFKTIERYFGHLSHPTKPLSRKEPTLLPAFDHQNKIDTHQCHTIIGARIPGMYDRRRHAIALFTNILGGPGMNSLLNIALRERRGYVYNVDASSTLFTDCGYMAIYFGCDPDDLNACRRVTNNLLEDLASSPMKPRALDAAKKQYLGQIVVGSENREQVAISTGRAMLYHGKVSNAEDIISRIKDLSTDDMMEIAQMIAPACHSILSLR